MYVIGLTGPSGAGKTTALRVLEQMGGTVYDCDAIYHEMLRSDPELLGRIEAAFPGSVVDGALDRKALGAKVFADPAGLQRLTDLTQPFVAKRVMEEITKSEASASGGSDPSTGLEAGPPPLQAGEVSAAPADAASPLCHSERSAAESKNPYPPDPDLRCTAPDAPGGFAVIDAIGLFESGLAECCDLTVAVVADPEVRVKRLMARDGITEDYAQSRIHAQKPTEWFAGQADLVLENNGSEADFAERCRRAFTKKLRESAPMRDYAFVSLSERPELEQEAAAWFHSRWGVPEEAYLACMDACLNGKTPLGWYLCLHGAEIVGGLGVIENDFHDRKDLRPNVCAVYTEPEHRGRGIAGGLLELAVEDLRSRGISPVYLVTDHTGFYERYGWEFLCHVRSDGEEHLTRLYIHR